MIFSCHFSSADHLLWPCSAPHMKGMTSSVYNVMRQETEVGASIVTRLVFISVWSGSCKTRSFFWRAKNIWAPPQVCLWKTTSTEDHEAQHTHVGIISESRSCRLKSHHSPAAFSTTGTSQLPDSSREMNRNQQPRSSEVCTTWPWFDSRHFACLSNSSCFTIMSSSQSQK